MRKIEKEIKEVFDAVEPFLNKKERDVFWVLRYRTTNSAEAASILGIPRTTFISRKEKLYEKLRKLIIEKVGINKVDEINKIFFRNEENE